MMAAPGASLWGREPVLKLAVCTITQHREHAKCPELEPTRMHSQHLVHPVRPTTVKAGAQGLRDTTPPKPLLGSETRKGAPP